MTFLPRFLPYEDLLLYLAAAILYLIAWRAVFQTLASGNRNRYSDD